LFPKDPFNFPMCTMADKPRSPEHCIVFAMEKAWPEKHDPENKNPAGVPKLDGDNEDHILFCQEAAKVHARKFGLDADAINYKLTQGVVKRIIPAIASTNACISAMCATEAFKILTACYEELNNFTNFVGSESCTTNPISNFLNKSCVVCGTEPINAAFPDCKTLQNFIDFVVKDKGLFALFERPSLMWDEDPDAEGAHDNEYIYSPNKMFQDEELLDMKLSEIIPAGVQVLLNQVFKKFDKETGQTVMETKTNYLKIKYIPLTEWLKEHEEWIDAWGPKYEDEKRQIH